MGTTFDFAALIVLILEAILGLLTGGLFGGLGSIWGGVL